MVAAVETLLSLLTLDNVLLEVVVLVVTEHPQALVEEVPAQSLR